MTGQFLTPSNDYASVLLTLNEPQFSTLEAPIWQAIYPTNTDFRMTGKTAAWFSGYTYPYFDRPVDANDAFKFILSGSTSNFKIVHKNGKQLYIAGLYSTATMETTGQDFELIHLGSQSINDPYLIRVVSTGNNYLHHSFSQGDIFTLYEDPAVPSSQYIFFKIT